MLGAPTVALLVPQNVRAADPVSASVTTISEYGSMSNRAESPATTALIVLLFGKNVAPLNVTT